MANHDLASCYSAIGNGLRIVLLIEPIPYQAMISWADVFVLQGKSYCIVQIIREHVSIIILNDFVGCHTSTVDTSDSRMFLTECRVPI